MFSDEPCGASVYAVARQTRSAEDALEEGAPAGGEHDRTRRHPEACAGAAHEPCRAADVIVVTEQFEDGMMIENGDAGFVHVPAHEAHVVRAAQIGDVEAAVLLARKGVAPFDQLLQVLVSPVCRAQHPATVGKAGRPLEALLYGGRTALAGRNAPRACIGRRRGPLVP